MGLLVYSLEKRGNIMEKVVERFLKYVQYDTKSKEDVEQFPSTPGQRVLLEALASELKDLGMKDVSIDSYGYVFASLPANTERTIPTIGFIAHVDTSPDMPGNNIKYKIVENYDGKDIMLNDALGIVLSPVEFPELKAYKGRTIITTDGTTLLGADDKAGVAEIMTAMEHLIKHPEIEHGNIRVALTPDEEVGRGVDFFDVERFNADFAYTIDGGPIGELEYENFNAAKAVITVNGVNTHPGTAKGVMKNSVLIGAELVSMFPKDEIPARTEGYEGFYHLEDIKGTVEKTVLKLKIRDFDLDGLKRRKDTVQNIVNKLNDKYGKGTLVLDMKDQYYNMLEKINENKHIVDIPLKP
jgi:tripeptide aminopeptidase